MVKKGRRGAEEAREFVFSQKLPFWDGFDVRTIAIVKRQRMACPRRLQDKDTEEHDLHSTMQGGHRKMHSSPPTSGARRWTWVSAMAGASALVSLAAVSTVWRDGTAVTGRRGGIVLSARNLGGRRAKIAALAAKEKAKALDSGWSIAKMLKNGLDWDGKEDVETGHNVIMVSVCVHVHAECCDVGNGRASARRRSFRAPPG